MVSGLDLSHFLFLLRVRGCIFIERYTVLNIVHEVAKS